MKEWDSVEANVYSEIQATNDPISQFTARYFGEVDRDDLPSDVGDVKYFRLSNISHPYGQGARLMDCKIGTRSFSESELKKTNPRPDLFERMISLDPSYPS